MQETEEGAATAAAPKLGLYLDGIDDADAGGSHYLLAAVAGAGAEWSPADVTLTAIEGATLPLELLAPGEAGGWIVAQLAVLATRKKEGAFHARFEQLRGVDHVRRVLGSAGSASVAMREVVDRIVDRMSEDGAQVLLERAVHIEGEALAAQVFEVRMPEGCSLDLRIAEAPAVVEAPEQASSEQPKKRRREAAAEVAVQEAPAVVEAPQGNA